MQMKSKRDTEQDCADPNSERGVSDILAFSLTFTIIITGAGIVSTVALDPITDFSERQDVVNSERGFQAAASEIDRLHRSGSTYGQFDIVPGSGDLFLAKQEISTPGGLGSGIAFLEDPFTSSKLNFTDINDSIRQTTQSGQFLVVRTNTLLNRLGEDSSVGYEAGAVFREDAAGLSYEPSIRFRENGGNTEAYVSVVNLLPGENVSVASEFNNDLAIGPTQIPAGTPVTASQRFATFEVDRGASAQTNGDLGGDNFSIVLDGLIGTENWVEHFEEQAEDLSDVTVGPLSGVPGPVVTCACNDVTVRVVEVELSQLE